MGAPSDRPAAQPRSIDSLPHWGVWRREDGTKVPYSPATGHRAKSNDAATFGTRADAERALAPGKYTGLCILVDEALGITGGDLDHVIPEADAFDEAALPDDVRRVINDAATWTCWSPSGTGIRFIFGASLGRRFMTRNTSNRVCAAEAYTRSRFMTVCPDQRIAGTPDTLNTDAAVLEAWHGALGFPLRAAGQPGRLQPPSPAWSGLGRTNEQVLETAFRARNGDAIRRLFAGDTTGYPQSQSDSGFSSEADYALAGHLAGYTDDDAQLADLWRSSGLYRPKLDRDDYVDRTIANIRASQTWRWDPLYGGTTPPAMPVIVPPLPEGATRDEQLTHALDTIAALMAQLREARQTIAQQSGTITTLQERARLADERDAIQRNSKLGASRTTAAALASLFQEERPKEPGTPTPFRMPLAKLAQRTGLSAGTCSDHLKTLATFRTPDGSPVLFADTRHLPRQVDRETGEVVEPHREVWIGPAVDTTAFGYVLSQLVPANAPKHGGHPDRNSCPDHPDAGVLRRTKTTRKITRECAHCGLVLDVQVIPVGRETTEHIPTSRPMPHHAFTHESDDPGTEPGPIRHDAFGHDAEADPDPGPIPHLAASIDTHVNANLSSKMPDSPRLLNDAQPDPTGPPSGWQDDHRRVYGELYRGGVTP
jgi:hypothetical protein